MNKVEARKGFEAISRLLAQRAMEGDNGSVHELAASLMDEAGTDGLLECLEVILDAEFEPEELNLPPDNTLEVKTTPEGIRAFCAYIYGVGARRYLRLGPGESMGAAMQSPS